MKHPEFKYIATVSGSLNKQRTVIEIDRLTLPSDPTDCFRSLCRYNREYYEYWQSNNGSVARFDGACYSDYLPVDIDNRNLNQALKTTRNFLGYLENAFDVPLKSLRVYFSGSKGFSVELPTVLFGEVQPSPHMVAILKAVTKELNFDDFDFGLYKLNGLWRLPNSINSNSRLYKVPLTPHELFDLSIDEMTKKAQRPVNDKVFCDLEDWEPIEGLEKLWEESSQGVISKIRERVPVKSNRSTPNDLHFEGVEKGKRNDTAYMIARTLRSRGIPINEAKELIVVKWNPKNYPPVQDSGSLRRTVESAYSSDISDSGSIEITKHLRNDPYYNSFNNNQKVVYIYLITHLNEVEKIVWNKYTCYPNQMIFSYTSLAANAGVSEQTVKTLLKKLKGCGRISVETLLSEKGYSECSRLTFHCFDLTQHLTQDSSLSNGKEN